MFLRILMALVCFSAVFAEESVELHGSGTTNPSKYFMKTMDLFEERARAPLHMTYRAVGSSTGQKEFLGEGNGVDNMTAFNDFGSGDIPITKERFDALAAKGVEAIQIPFTIGAISVFFNINGIDSSEELDLDACTLARIFSRDIKSWDHPDIRAQNSGLTLPASNIEVGHRKKGSSSTAGLTEYIHKACPEHWKLNAGALVVWPEDTNVVEGSGGMASFISSTRNSIGYLDAGHGHREGFSEVALKNKDGQYHKSSSADIGHAAAEALKLGVLPASAASDHSTVNLYDMPGSQTWPITMFSYFYIRKDLSAMDGRTAGLLKAFVSYTLGSDGQDELAGFSFSKLPQSVVERNLAQVQDSISWPAEMKEFTFETSTAVGLGASDQVISVKRQSYGEYQRETFAKQIASIELQDIDSAAEIKALKDELASLKALVIEIESEKASSMIDESSELEDNKSISYIALAVAILSITVNAYMTSKLGQGEKDFSDDDSVHSTDPLTRGVEMSDKKLNSV